jgi:hypothetical protein
MARVTFVKKAQPRYRTVPVIDPATGEQKITPVLKKDGTPKTTKTGRAIVMRVTREDTTQPLPNRKCDKCGVEIKPGDSYKWTKTKGAYGGTKRFRCATCPTWTYAELSNSWSARVSVVTESFTGFDGETEDDAQSVLDDLAEQIRALAEESRETAENVREGFGHDTYVSEQADERADELDSWADEVEGTEVPSLPEPDEQDCDGCDGTGEITTETGEEDADGNAVETTESCGECDGTGQVTPEDPTDEQMDEWRDEVTDAIQSALDSCPI